MAEAKKSVKKVAEKAIKKDKTVKAKEKEHGIIQESVSAENEASPQDEEITSKTSETAKAGRRSAKAQKETEEKEAKEERKASAKEEKVEAKPKQTHKPARSKLERSGKKYRKAAELIEQGKEYKLEDALALAIKTSPVKFDATVELHINLAVDPKQADQNVRGTVVLPGGTGKSSRVAVVADASESTKAKAAGADISGADEVFALLDKEKLDFDILIAHPSQMPNLGKYARLLGPKGLMPNPKSGTVTTDITKAVKEAKAGRVEYRVDTTGIIHVGIGKVSFGADKLTQNATAILTNLKSNKPASVKGALILRAFATTTMGPSIPLSISDV